MTEDDELKFRAQVEHLRQTNGSLRVWLRGAVREAVVAFVLFLGLWGLDVEPATAARAAVGLWWMGMVGFAVLMAFIGAVSAAMGALFDAAKAAERKP